jgi:apolipoprotein N-acyltransferase
MALVFTLYHITRLATGNLLGRFTLIPYWLAFEYLHLNWDLSWPWLSLGNGMASYHHWIQWYEFTGMQGGSLWILMVNILIYQIMTASDMNSMLPKAILASAVLLLPVVVSLVMYYRHTDEGWPLRVVVVQPNVDPYNEKFNGSSDAQLEKMLIMAESAMDDSVQLVVFPETALPDGIWENNLSEHRQIKRLKEFLADHKGLSVLTGVTTLRYYEPGEKLSETARKHKMEDGHYDVYNTAMMLHSGNDSIPLYHKSKLVPGVEKMPYPSIFGFLEKYAIDLGGMSGSHGTDKEPTVFRTRSGALVAPVICYESIYIDYLRKYVRKGADLIAVITNDGWWGNTPGHRQHLAYAKLSAISLRKSIVRSANTGISCFINQRGDFIQPQLYWEPAVIKNTVLLNNRQTYFARFGNTLASASLILSAALLILLLIKNRSMIAKRGL